MTPENGVHERFLFVSYNNNQRKNMSASTAKRVLLVDNYDSYTFNIFHLLATEMHGNQPVVVQNDDFNGDFETLLCHFGHEAFACIVIGPGPGNPNDNSTLGLSKSILAHSVIIPILGICLGMQAIALQYGGKVNKSPVPMHGRLSEVTLTAPSPLFIGIEFPINVVRYHSLCVDCSSNSSKDLLVTSISPSDGVPMSLQHRYRPIYAVQFHPESVCAGEPGRLMIRNFLSLCGTTFTPPPPPALQTPTTGSSTLKLCVSKVANTHSVSAESLFFSSPWFPNDMARIWLDSSSGLERGSRYSILCTEQGPFQETVECFIQGKRMHSGESNAQLSKVDSCVLRVNHSKWLHAASPFSYLSHRIHELRPSSVVFEHKVGGFELLPFDFACGFMGVLGYGLRKLCGVKPCAIPHSGTPTLPEVNTLPDAAFFLASRAVVIDHADSDTMYILTLVDAECELEQLTWAQNVNEYLNQPSSPIPPAPLVHVEPQSVQLTSNRTNAQYEQDVDQCLVHIVNGESYEICLTNQVKGHTKVSVQTLYSTIRASNPAPLSALFQFSNFSILSSSPERYIRVTSVGQVESRPIKGTCKRARQDPALDLQLKQQLLSSEKDRAENLMIIDLVRNDLGRVCDVGTVQVPELIVCESFSTVHQLVSTIRGQLRPGCDAVEACRVCFPPGSMTGAPKLKTMQLIDSIEQEERGFYSGSLGFFSLNGSADFNVLIRSAVYITNTGEISIGAGGAVVALSNAEEERKEMQLKLETLGKTFDISY